MTYHVPVPALKPEPLVAPASILREPNLAALYNQILEEIETLVGLTPFTETEMVALLLEAKRRVRRDCNKTHEWDMQ